MCSSQITLSFQLLEITGITQTTLSSLVKNKSRLVYLLQMTIINVYVLKYVEFICCLFVYHLVSRCRDTSTEQVNNLSVSDWDTDYAKVSSEIEFKSEVIYKSEVPRKEEVMARLRWRGIGLELGPTFSIHHKMGE